MKRTTVQSSNIASIGYDLKSRTLEIEFLDGSVYQYFDVPETLFNGIMKADSHGKYLNEYIKGHYRYSRI